MVRVLCCSQSSPPIAGLRMCSSQCMHHIVQRRRSTLALNHLQAPPLLFFQQTWAYCFLFGRDAISAAAAAGPASPCIWGSERICNIVIICNIMKMKCSRILGDAIFQVLTEHYQQQKRHQPRLCHEHAKSIFTPSLDGATAQNAKKHGHHRSRKRLRQEAIYGVLPLLALA